MVVVFGSINVDLVTRVPRIPLPGETVAGSHLAIVPGGKGANQALAARYARAPVHLYGAVGNDVFADQALVHLRGAGIDLTGVARVDSPTGAALIHVDDGGENAIVVVPGANALARARQVSDAMLSPAATLLLQLETPLAEVAALAARARRRGARTILNAAPATALPATLLRDVDVLLVNEHEAALVAAALGVGAAPDEFVAALRAYGTQVIVTLGALGAVACVDGDVRHLPSPACDVVDTTGAGDAFAGTLAAALDRDTPLPQALATALAAGSLACTYRGAQSAPAPPAA
jgi:ribokinase